MLLAASRCAGGLRPKRCSSDSGGHLLTGNPKRGSESRSPVGAVVCCVHRVSEELRGIHLGGGFGRVAD